MKEKGYYDHLLDELELSKTTSNAHKFRMRPVMYGGTLIAVGDETMYVEKQHVKEIRDYCDRILKEMGKEKSWIKRIFK
jgi:hypothetical protein